MDDWVPQPPRADGDGSAGLRRGADDFLYLNVAQDGEEMHVRMSMYNAWRVLGMLTQMLGVPIPRKIGKTIKL